jgi:hypothetical protein
VNTKKLNILNKKSLDKNLNWKSPPKSVWQIKNIDEFLGM